MHSICHETHPQTDAIRCHVAALIEACFARPVPDTDGNESALFSPAAMAVCGGLLNFQEAQLPQLQADLTCLFAQPLARFPSEQAVSDKLSAAARLHQQVRTQNGPLWQLLRVTEPDENALADRLVNWLRRAAGTLTPLFRASPDGASAAMVTQLLLRTLPE